jgi:GNAT superfamily N-acetyltransferase
VDLRGILLSGRCAVFAGDDPRQGFVARSWDFPFAAVAGRPDAATVLRAVDDAERAGITEAWAEWHLLAPIEAAQALAEALPGWRRRGVTLHRFPGELPQPPGALPHGGELRLAPEGSAAAGLDLGHLPAELRREMELEYVTARPMAAALVDRRVAAFCYAPLVTETLWDVAIDTLAPFRRQGLASACFEALAAYLGAGHLGGGGRRPVWGALDANLSSLRLAERLGFVRAAALVSFVRPREAVAAP